MTLQNTSNTISYTGNASATVFPYTFPIPDADNLEVTLLEIATGTESAPLSPSLYSASGLGTANGGNVTYPLSGPALPSTHKINIRRVMSPTQDLELTNQSSWLPDELEKQLDRTTMQIQQVFEELDRTVKVALGSGVDPAQLAIDLFNAAADAQMYAGQAASSAGTASTKAGEAAGSALAAAGSASTANGAATTATTQAGIATTKAGEALTSANDAEGFRDETEGFRDAAEGFKNQASGYRDDAQGFAGAAASSAGDAAGYASAASGSAGTAAGSAGTATTQAGLAEDAKDAAEAARDKAQEWAENPEDVSVEPGEYSAYHWAKKAEEAVGGDAFLKKVNNLSDLPDAATARTNLGLGNSATRNVGTAANTIAAGNDSRITGAAQKASNLGDLSDPGAARTNLNLGDAATKNTGTAAGTVAAGDDSRIVGAMPISGGAFTGSIHVGGGGSRFIYLDGAGSNAIEIGRTDNVAGNAYIDFHSGAVSVDYDVRLIATGGNGTSGKGTLYIEANIIGGSGIANANAFLDKTAGKLLVTDKVWDSTAYVNLGASLTGNLTLDFATFFNAYGTATGNITFNAVSNPKNQSGLIEITASGGDRTVGFNTTYFCTPDNEAIDAIPSGKTVQFSYTRTQAGKVELVRMGEVA